MIVEMLAKRVHLLVQGFADGGGVSFTASDAAYEGRIDAQAAGDTAKEATKNVERRERDRVTMRLGTIHDTFQEHGS
jgi:hypothetical protein